MPPNEHVINSIILQERGGACPTPPHASNINNTKIKMYYGHKCHPLQLSSATTAARVSNNSCMSQHPQQLESAATTWACLSNSSI